MLKDRYFRGKTQAQIAKELKVSQMTISRLEKKIIENSGRSLQQINANLIIHFLTEKKPIDAFKLLGVRLLRSHLM